MAPKKKAASKAATPAPFKPSAAGAVKDKEEKQSIFRADLGESLPPQTPFPTATDKHK